MWLFKKKEKPRALDTEEKQLYIVETLDNDTIITDEDPFNMGGDVYRGYEYYTCVSPENWSKVKYYYKAHEVCIYKPNIAVVILKKGKVLCEYEYKNRAR